jgi:2,4-dienoyl-CoA reductase-like NADH-dependent reductase (Old Yellow Enzyme family)
MESRTVLATPFALPCGVSIPNRLVKAAMTEALSDDYGRPTEKICRLYERWSQGGCGLLITGNVHVDRRYVERPGNIAIDGTQDEEQIEKLKSYAQAGQKYGSKIFVQLSHGGRQSNGLIFI